MKGNVTVPKSDFSKNFKVETVQIFDNLTIGKNTYKGETVENIIPSITGFVPIGIVGTMLTNGTTNGANNTTCFMVRVYLTGDDNTSVYYMIRNTHATESAKLRLRLRILYVANT